jgi:hypothetical protein
MNNHIHLSLVSNHASRLMSTDRDVHFEKTNSKLLPIIDGGLVIEFIGYSSQIYRHTSDSCTCASGIPTLTGNTEVGSCLKRVSGRRVARYTRSRGRLIRPIPNWVERP